MHNIPANCFDDQGDHRIAKLSIGLRIGNHLWKSILVAINLSIAVIEPH